MYILYIYDLSRNIECVIKFEKSEKKSEKSEKKKVAKKNLVLFIFKLDSCTCRRGFDLPRGH